VFLYKANWPSGLLTGISVLDLFFSDFFYIFAIGLVRETGDSISISKSLSLIYFNNFYIRCFCQGGTKQFAQREKIMASRL